MEIREYIQHPELMDRDSLYELRSLLAQYPYFQTIRLLLLQNLYLLHDPDFDEELRRAAIFMTDRKVIFQLIEAFHYQLTPQPSATRQPASAHDGGSRTETLIDSFLNSIPDDAAPVHEHRKPTPADAAVDYVAYLLESQTLQMDDHDGPQLKGHDLIDTFLEQEQGRIILNDLPSDTVELPPPVKDDSSDDIGEEYFTETLARIYIKQGRYQKALDVISRLNQQLPHKNAYFSDQIRFLEKLIINSNKQKN